MHLKLGRREYLYEYDPKYTNNMLSPPFYKKYTGSVLVNIGVLEAVQRHIPVA
jgi:hypothetical protein